MAYVNQSVEEILVLARHGALKKTSRNRALIEALGQDILGSLDDDDLYETFLMYVRDLKQEKREIREIEVAAALRKADDESAGNERSYGDVLGCVSRCETLRSGTGCSTVTHLSIRSPEPKSVQRRYRSRATRTELAQMSLRATDAPKAGIRRKLCHQPMGQIPSKIYDQLSEQYGLAHGHLRCQHSRELPRYRRRIYEEQDFSGLDFQWRECQEPPFGDGSSFDEHQCEEIPETSRPSIYSVISANC